MRKRTAFLDQHSASRGTRPSMKAALCAQEKYYGKEVIIADREMVESQSDDILAGAAEADVSFLVVGDPFGCCSVFVSAPGTYVVMATQCIGAFILCCDHYMWPVPQD